MDGGDADGCGIERACGGEAGVDGFEGGNVEVQRGFGGDGGIAVDDGCELDRFAGALELAVDAEVVAPEGSRTDNGDA